MSQHTISNKDARVFEFVAEQLVRHLRSEHAKWAGKHESQRAPQVDVVTLVSLEILYSMVYDHLMRPAYKINGVNVLQALDTSAVKFHPSGDLE